MFLILFIFTLFILVVDQRLLALPASDKSGSYFPTARLVIWSALIFFLIIISERVPLALAEAIQDIGIVCFVGFVLLYLERRHGRVTQLNAACRGYQYGLSKRAVDDAPAPAFVLMADAIEIYLLWLVCLLAVSLAFSFFGDRWAFLSSSPVQILFFSLLSSLVTFALVARASKKFYQRRSFRYNLGLVLGRAGVLRTVIVPAFLALVFAYFSAQIIVQRPVTPDTPLSEIFSEVESPAIIIFFIVLATAVAPLVEEVVFRGYLFHIFQRFFSARFAFYVVALSFSVLHFHQYWGDWTALVVITILGFVLTLVRTLSGSTLASVVMHYVYNGGVIFMASLLFQMANPAMFEYKMYFENLELAAKERLLVKSIETQPAWPEGYYEMARLILTHYHDDDRQLQQAKGYIDQALRLDPDNFEYKKIKLKIMMAANNWDEAEGYYFDLKRDDKGRDLPEDIQYVFESE